MMIELQRRDGTMFRVDPEMIAKLARDYRGINVEGELLKMQNWLEANPRNRKKDVHRFIVNWLNRAKPSDAAVTPQTSRHYALIAERNRPAPEPVQFAAQEVVSAHLSELRRTLGMRR